MTGRWVLSLPYPKPPDGLSENWRGHHMVKARSVKAVRELVMRLTHRAQIPVMQRIQVELVWVVKDRRKRDADNIVPLLKATADGLASDRGISAHIVHDDSPEFCVKLMPRIEHQPDATPHFEVIVTDISHRPDAVDQLMEERGL